MRKVGVQRFATKKRERKECRLVERVSLARDIVCVK